MYAPSLAAFHLASQLGGGEALWLARLANWRRSSRKGPPPIPHSVTEAGNPTYDHDDLEAFIAENIGKQAFVAEARKNSPLKAGAAAHIDSASGEAPNVRLILTVTGSMQATYALDYKDARRLAAMLTKAADQIEKITPMHGDGLA